MTKQQLVVALAHETGLDLTTAGTAVDSVIDIITRTVADGRKVTLTGFGTFEAVHRAERVGRNPQTGEPVEIPATRVPKFRPGTRFKDAVAKGARLEPVAA